MLLKEEKLTTEKFHIILESGLNIILQQLKAVSFEEKTDEVEEKSIESLICDIENADECESCKI